MSKSRQLRRYTLTCQNPNILKGSNLILNPPQEDLVLLRFYRRILNILPTQHCILRGYTPHYLIEKLSNYLISLLNILVILNHNFYICLVILQANQLAPRIKRHDHAYSVMTPRISHQVDVDHYRYYSNLSVRKYQIIKILH